MTTTQCLNCEKAINDNYCAGCGQKTDTHRITLKHFVLHDLLHGTFHIEKGILFTAKQALVRPGKAGLDYISGKRIRYYNVFYLILISIGVMLFTRHVGDYFNDDALQIDKKVYLNDASKRLDELFSQKSKIILLLFVPIAALNSFILFRRKKLNLSEHCILSGMVLLGIVLISTASNIYFHLNNYLNLNGTIASFLVAAIIVSYVCYAYVNAFASDYSRLGIAYRILLYFALFCLELLVFMIILIGIATHWKFGEINVNPFG